MIQTRTRKRKDTHVTIVVEADEEDFRKIIARLRRALRICPGRPSYSITRVDFRQ